MKKQYLILFTLAGIGFWSCAGNKTDQKEQNFTVKVAISNDSLMTRIQYETFQYFWDNAEPTSGMGRERTHMDGKYPDNDLHIVTTGGSGFGLMAILVGIERGFITQEQALQRFEQITDFLEKADRFHGAWPHWLNGETGKVKPFGTKDNGGDLVETAFLVQGLLTVREYYKDGNAREKGLAAKIDDLWKGVEWNWYTRGEKVLYWHWSPQYAWEMDFPVGGYNECLIMYVLAAASPTFPIGPEVYHQGWARNGAITDDTTFMGYETVLDHYETSDDPVGPLFWAHYSYLGLDPRNLKDRYADYWKLNQNHALIHYAYALENPKGFEGYGKNNWGLTSSYSTNGYNGHQPSNDTGVISPTAALSSFPYTPEQSMDVLRFIYTEADSLVGDYGPYDAYSFEKDWYTRRYLAIDQGPIPVMIENHRTGKLWALFMGAPEVSAGLERIGFTSY